MGFQFSLATVLRVRGILEDQEERMLQRILFEIAQTREALTQLEAAIEASSAERRENAFKSVIGHTIHAAYGEIEERKQTKKNLEEKLAKLDELRAQQVRVYEKARRNREMLTDMREEKRSAYDSDISKLEQKALDDVFIARRGRS